MKNEISLRKPKNSRERTGLRRGGHWDEIATKAGDGGQVLERYGQRDRKRG